MICDADDYPRRKWEQFLLFFWESGKAAHRSIWCSGNFMGINLPRPKDLASIHTGTARRIRLKNQNSKEKCKIKPSNLSNHSLKLWISLCPCCFTSSRSFWIWTKILQRSTSASPMCAGAGPALVQSSLKARHCEICGRRRTWESRNLEWDGPMGPCYHGLQ